MHSLSRPTRRVEWEFNTVFVMDRGLGNVDSDSCSSCGYPSSLSSTRSSINSNLDSPTPTMVQSQKYARMFSYPTHSAASLISPNSTFVSARASPTKTILSASPSAPPESVHESSTERGCIRPNCHSYPRLQALGGPVRRSPVTKSTPLTSCPQFFSLLRLAQPKTMDPNVEKGSSIPSLADSCDRALTKFMSLYAILLRPCSAAITTTATGPNRPIPGPSGSRSAVVAPHQALHVSTSFACSSPVGSTASTRGRPAFRFPTQRRSLLAGSGSACCTNSSATHTCTCSVDRGIISAGHSPEPDSPLSAASATQTNQSPAEFCLSQSHGHVAEDVSVSPDVSLDELAIRSHTGVARSSTDQIHQNIRPLDSSTILTPSSELPPMRRQLTTRNTSGPVTVAQNTPTSCANCGLHIDQPRDSPTVDKRHIGLRLRPENKHRCSSRENMHGFQTQSLTVTTTQSVHSPSCAAPVALCSVSPSSPGAGSQTRQSMGKPVSTLGQEAASASRSSSVRSSTEQPVPSSCPVGHKLRPIEGSLNFQRCATDATLVADVSDRSPIPRVPSPLCSGPTVPPTPLLPISPCPLGRAKPGMDSVSCIGTFSTTVPGSKTRSRSLSCLIHNTLPVPTAHANTVEKIIDSINLDSNVLDKRKVMY
ncbi:unnamed protein product [Echinostoma caproni]|uniref:Uncharacterized protein n=1 Tax=Echinostoma caproni TaxID=27848 RepID=A0A183AMV0_9TREM|nr:unnamed protein product [Echinostoma caproni]